MAFKDTGKTPVEPEVAIHRIRITLTSRNVKSLEKGDVRGPDQRREGKESQSERTRSHAYQDFENHHQENALWRRFQDLGSLPDENPQAAHRLAQSLRDCQADHVHQYRAGS
ncbi:40S ribosomal protein S20 isoform X2 [Carlito syrichta]|uniref:40S ribosomal protein S20 isoform X2 n=1 Tax=Carlito syrichta TaxID=1868482 RepID=A0A3Q0DXM1_CARSF|nr:40S ribosomal protein S20 isoform X2 [Carlito syrichta]